MNLARNSFHRCAGFLTKLLGRLKTSARAVRYPFEPPVAARTFLAAGCVGCAVISPAQAETIKEALALAYTNNPTLNAQRAATRSVDETVPIAKAQLRPFIFADASAGWTHSTVNHNLSTELRPGGFGVGISQTLWDSFRTRNDVAGAQSGVYASREALRNTEQNVLFNAASIYMDVLRDQAVVGFRRNALEFLNELLRSEQARFDVGESTRTDVAQAEAQREQSLAELTAAQANLQTSIAIYRQIIGIEPRALQYPASVFGMAPNTIDQAFDIAYGDHPAIQATRFLVDQADWSVKSSESDLLPTVSLEGSANRGYTDLHDGGATSDSYSVFARLAIPIYQGGSVAATVRQNKEILGQRRIQVDETVDNVRAAIVAAYSQYNSAAANSQSAEAQVRAARLALEGTVEERNVGQRTTLDVLQAQQDVINAELLLVQSRRNTIVAGYAVLSAIGWLDADRLSLAVVTYDPVEHYEIVKDKWFGLRTPDGR